MSMFKQSVVVPMVKRDTMKTEDFLDEVKSIGLEAIEFWDREEDFLDEVEAAKSRGLEIASMVGHSHVCATAGTHAEGFSRAANHERLEEELRVSIDIAAEHGIPGVITLSGHRNASETDYASLLVCAEGLKRITPYAEEKGVNLNMELLNTTIDHPHYLCDSTDWAVNLCELVDSPRCKILYDIYHMQIMEGDLIRSIKRASKWIGHYHTAGVPGRNDLDDTQEIHYPGVARAISETGYDLYLGHEFMPKGDAIKALQQAYEACKV